jgi:hypothetical protein
MNTKIENRSTCEVRSVIQFLNAQNFRPAEIHRQIVEVCCEVAMNKGNVRKHQNVVGCSKKAGLMWMTNKVVTQTVQA